MPTPILLAAQLAAHPAHAGWIRQSTKNGCSYFRGNTDRSGLTPVRVECDWDDVDAKAIHENLASPDAQVRVFSGLAEARVISSTRVYQRFSARGVSDREVVVDVETDTVPGGWAYRWRKSADQTNLRGDAVEVGATEGMWEVTEVDGRVRLVYELRLGLGGMVPTFMVRWAQGGAVQQTIEELKAAVTLPR